MSRHSYSLTPEFWNLIPVSSFAAGQPRRLPVRWPRNLSAKLVGQTEDVAGRLLAGHEVVVKSGVDIVTSTRYGEALRAIGVASRSMPDALQLDDDLIGRLEAKPNVATATPLPMKEGPAPPVPVAGPKAIAGRSCAVQEAAALAWPRFWARQIDFAVCWIIVEILGYLLERFVPVGLFAPSSTNIVSPEGNPGHRKAIYIGQYRV